MGSEDHIFSYTAHRTGSTKLGSVFYETAGNGRSTLLLIHGFPFDRRLWYKLIPYLHDVKIMIPDLPGFGHSPLLAERADIEDYADCMHAVLNAEGIEECVIAGHSMGGYVALAFAERYPHMLRGLSLVHSTAYADDDERKLKREQVKAFIREHGAQQFTRSFIPGPFSPDFSNTLEIETLIHWAEDCTTEGLTAAVDAMKHRPDRRGILSNLQVPVQLITGGKDPVFSYRTAFEQATLPRVTTVDYIKETGHMGMVEHTEVTANALNAFVQFCCSYRKSAD